MSCDGFMRIIPFTSPVLMIWIRKERHKREKEVNYAR